MNSNNKPSQNGKNESKDRKSGRYLIEVTPMMICEQERYLYNQPLPKWDTMTAKNHAVYKTDSLLIDEAAGLVYKNGKLMELGKTEFIILLHLVKNPTMVCSRSVLLNLAEWRFNHKLSDNTLSKHVNRLRHKLNENSKDKYILTRNATGYLWKHPVQKYWISR